MKNSLQSYSTTINDSFMFDNKNVLVVIDEGHGRISPYGVYVTSGKRSPNWSKVLNPQHNKDIYYEGAGNKEIGTLVKEGLALLGIRFMSTTSTYKDISLSKRCAKINKISRNNGKVFGISIHSNAGGGRGIEVFTSPGETLSDKMATISLQEASKVFPGVKLRQDFSDGDPDKEAHFYILVHTNIPIFLPEAFFMDNKKECTEILMTKKGKERIAEWHINTIKRIITELY